MGKVREPVLEIFYLAVRKKKINKKKIKIKKKILDRENIMPKKIEFESCDHLPERGFAHRIGWPGARVRSPTSTFPNVRKKKKIRIMKSPCQESLLSTLKKGCAQSS